MVEHRRNRDAVVAQRVTQRGAHLYVMQSADGLIKIGRSSEIERRRKKLERNRLCSIRLVLTLRGKGADEARILADLREFRAFGEWFLDSPKMREAACESIGRRVPFQSEVRQLRLPPKRGFPKALSTPPAAP